MAAGTEVEVPGPPRAVTLSGRRRARRVRPEAEQLDLPSLRREMVATVGSTVQPASVPSGSGRRRAHGGDRRRQGHRSRSSLVRSDRTGRSSVAAGHRRTRRPGCGPRNRRSRGVVLGRRARRLSRGSVDGPFGTAQDFRTPSTSSRKSKCRLEASCRWITNRGRPPGSPPPGSPETSRLRFARYALSASSVMGCRPSAVTRRSRIV